MIGLVDLPAEEDSCTHPVIEHGICSSCSRTFDKPTISFEERLQICGVHLESCRASLRQVHTYYDLSKIKVIRLEKEKESLSKEVKKLTRMIAKLRKKEGMKT